MVCSTTLMCKYQERHLEWHVYTLETQGLQITKYLVYEVYITKWVLKQCLCYRFFRNISITLDPANLWHLWLHYFQCADSFALQAICMASLKIRYKKENSISCLWMISIIRRHFSESTDPDTNALRQISKFISLQDLAWQTQLRYQS